MRYFNVYQEVGRFKGNWAPLKAPDASSSAKSLGTKKGPYTIYEEFTGYCELLSGNIL